MILMDPLYSTFLASTIIHLLQQSVEGTVSRFVAMESK